MKRTNLILGIFFLVCFGMAFVAAQIQQSGGPGSTVTANQGTGGASAWLVTGTGGTFPIAGSQAQPLKQTATNFNLASELFTGGTSYDARQIRALTASDVVTVQQSTAANLKVDLSGTAANSTPIVVSGTVRNAPLTSCGVTIFDSGPIFLPTSTTSITGTATCVETFYLTNTDSVAHTITVTDGSTACAAGVCTYVGPAFSLPALSNMQVPMYHLKFTGGIKWNVADASSNKVIGQAFGYQ